MHPKPSTSKFSNIQFTTKSKIMKTILLSLSFILFLCLESFCQEVISRSSIDVLSIKREDANNGNTFNFRISDNVNGSNVIAKRSMSLVAKTSADFAVLTNTGSVNPQFVIKSSGNVGIGVNNPENKLHVNGAISVGGRKIVFGDYKGGTGEIIENVNYGLSFATDKKQRLFINNIGNVGIGTGNPGKYKLAVEGDLGARRVVVHLSSWSDFVFSEDYALPSLKEVDAYIQQHNHLPNIPSESEVIKEGVDVGEMQKLLLQKIEELTLYTIEQQKQIDQLKKEIGERGTSSKN